MRVSAHVGSRVVTCESDCVLNARNLCRGSPPNCHRPLLNWLRFRPGGRSWAARFRLGRLTVIHELTAKDHRAWETRAPDLLRWHRIQSDAVGFPLLPMRHFILLFLLLEIFASTSFSSAILLQECVQKNSNILILFRDTSIISILTHIKSSLPWVGDGNRRTGFPMSHPLEVCLLQFNLLEFYHSKTCPRT